MNLLLLYWRGVFCAENKWAVACNISALAECSAAWTICNAAPPLNVLPSKIAQNLTKSEQLKQCISLQWSISIGTLGRAHRFL